MKKILLGALLASPIAAQAVDFEIGLGVSKFNTLADGMWYQEGFPHRLDLQRPAASVGISGPVNDWLRWRVAYHYLGNVGSSAYAVPDATDYVDGVGGYNLQTKSCNGECGPTRMFVGHGNLQGIAITLEPHFDYRGFQFAIEGGAWIYHANWHVTAYNNFDKPNQWPAVEEYRYSRKIDVSYTVGASISRGNWTVAYQYFKTPARNMPFPVIWSNVQLLSLRYKF